MRWLIFIGLFLSLSFRLVGADKEADLGQDYANVLRLIAAEDFDAALSAGREILNQDIHFERVYPKLVALYREKQMLGAALEYFEGLVAKNQQDAFPHYGLGLTYLARKEYDKAREYFKRSVDLKGEIPSLYFNLINGYRGLNRMDDAVVYLENKLKGNPDNAYLHYGLAYAYRLKSSWNKALTHLGESQRIRPNLLESRRLRATIYFNISRFAEALDETQKCLARSEQTNDLENMAADYTRLGEIYSKLSDYAPALEMFQNSLKITQQIGDKKGKGANLLGIGAAQRNLGHYPQALSHYQNALAISRQTGDREIEATCYINMGAVYWNLGRYQQALYYHQRHLRMYRQLKDRSGEGKAFNNIGAIYKDLGDLAQALDYFERSLKIKQQIGDRKGEGSTLSNMGVVYKDLGQLDQALNHFNRGLELCRLIKDKTGEGAALSNLGSVYKERRDFPRALDYFQQSLTLHRQTKQRAMQGLILTNIGETYARLGNYRKAMDCQRRALTIGEEINSPEIIWRSREGLAQTFVARGELFPALDHFKRAIQAIDKMRAALKIDEHKTLFLHSKLGVYEKTISLLHQLHEKIPGAGYDRDAFAYAEAAKARALRDLLAEAGAQVRSRIDPKHLSRESALQQKLSRIQKRLQEAGGSREEHNRLTVELRQASDEYNHFIVELRQVSPAYAHLKYPEPYRMEQIQNTVIDPESVLLEFLLGDEQSFLWFITKKDRRFHVLPKRKEIEAKVERFLKIISNPHMPLPHLALAEEIGRLLLGPVVTSIPTGYRMLIVPDGILHKLPFEALSLSTQPGPGKPESSRYLAEAYRISYAPSASVLGWIQKAKKTQPQKLLAMGDPIFNTKIKPTAGQTRSAADDPLEEESEAGDVLDDRRWYGEKGLRLAPLPFSREEVLGIAELYRPEERAVYVQEKANETVLKSLDLGQYQYIHFATHGWIDDENPAMSGLALTQDDQSQEDGFLQAHEIFNLQLNADMVVLSACQTGLGKLLKGEGVIGLTRTFLYAGASAVVVSLWNVSDRSTSELMQAMYKHLKTGLSKEAALRQAKLDHLRRGGKQSHPFYWAPFVLIGDGN